MQGLSSRVIAMTLLIAAAAASPDSVMGQTHWRGSPPPACQGFMITECGLTGRLSGKLEDAGSALTWDLGYMRNVGPHSAVGGSFYLRAYSFEWMALGFRPRYRHWLSPTVSLDIAPGIVLSTEGDFQGQDSPPELALGSINVSVALGVGDLAAVSTEFDILRLQEGTTETGWYLGARFGSWMSLVATGVLGIVGLVGVGSSF